jgi:hypothetical protein
MYSTNLPPNLHPLTLNPEFPILRFGILLPPPGPARLQNCTWLLGSVQRAQHIVDHAKLLRAIARRAQRVAERPFQMYCARRAHFLGDLAQTDDRDGWDAGGLDGAGDQSHGLIADASGRRQQYCVDAILLELAGHLRRAGVQQRLNVRRLDMAHEAVACSQGADLPALGQLAQQPNRQQNI